ncbi:hypothetical protein ACHAXN_010008 [Cyclotella atomus]|jgi:deoxyinosine 3'endonuclease (endonuclease V)
MQVDENQLQAWREEQVKVAANVVIPYQNTLTTTTDQCLNNVLDEYRGRYKHVQSNAQIFAGENILLIGGVDVAFSKESSQKAVAVYVILSYSNFFESPSVIYRDHQTYVTPPYISSYLSFRESEPLLSLITKQLQTRPEFRPHAIMVDGNGMWHERRAGLACFIGKCGIPCIGAGKTWYNLHGKGLDVKRAVARSVEEWHRLFGETKDEIDAVTRDKSVIFDSVSFTDAEQRSLHSENAAAPAIGKMLSNLSRVAYGLAVPMLDEMSPDREILGYSLIGHGCHLAKSRLRGSKNPVYISIGNKITLQDAVTLVACTCGMSRIPEPIREADSFGRSLLSIID